MCADLDLSALAVVPCEYRVALAESSPVSHPPPAQVCNWMELAEDGKVSSHGALELLWDPHPVT